MNINWGSIVIRNIRKFKTPNREPNTEPNSEPNSEPNGNKNL